MFQPYLSASKDFMGLLIPLLAAHFQVRLCPTKTSVWHCKYSGVMTKIWLRFPAFCECYEPYLLHQVLTSVLLQKAVGNADLGDQLTPWGCLPWWYWAFLVSCVPHHPPAPSLAHSMQKHSSACSKWSATMVENLNGLYLLWCLAVLNQSYCSSRGCFSFWCC